MVDMNVGNLVAGLTMDTSGFSKGLSDAAGGLDTLKTNIATAKTALIGLMTNPAVLALATVSAIGTIGKAAFDMSEELNAAYDVIRVGTGATGDALDELKASFDNVFSSGSYDVESVGTAIADLNTRLGLTGEELETLATQFLQLSRITETDVGANIENVTRLFQDWNVTTADYESTLDSLFKVSQATGISIDELSTKSVQYGASLRSMGFTLEEATTMLGKFEKEGVNTETALSSMRIALAKFAEEGVDAKTAFSQVIDEIKGLDETAGTARAIEVFGSRAGTDMAAAIREGRFEFDELMKSIEESPETIAAADAETYGFAERVQELGNKVMLALTPLGEGIEVGLDRVFKLLNAFADKVLPHIVSYFTFVEGLLGRLREPFEKVFSRIGETIMKFWGDSEGTSGDALTVIVDLVTKGVDTLATVIEWFLDYIYPIIEVVLAAIVGTIKVFSALIAGDWDALWDTMLETTSRVLQGLADIIFRVLNTILDFVEGFVNSIIDGINSVIRSINSITGAELAMMSYVNLNIDTPDISQMLGLDTESPEGGVIVNQNITINGDVNDASKLYSEEEKLAYRLGQEVSLG
jgi:TP901 family phage tail tape measure protein